MTLPELTLAILVLLVTPGPTNTLLFLAGSERGFFATLRLIPAELAGYSASVVPLMLVGAQLVARFPATQAVITLMAAAWVAVLAVRLFRVPSQERLSQGVSARLVFVTTMLNPKALIFGLVLLPGPAAQSNLAIFLALVAVVAAGWAAMGARLGIGTAMPILRRVAALWLAIISATLVMRGIGA
jgi:threonine/homoserine/homoserine lactone efflux protein